MEFSGDLGEWQRRVAEAPEGMQRRLAVFRAIDPREGEAILELGCGSGPLLHDLARAVGPGGRAIGLDAEAEQLAAARTRCAGLDQVTLIEGDAEAMPLEDASLDVVTATNTAEYIPDTARLLAETRRVLKPGGRLVLLSVLWDHFLYHGADPALTDRILTAWRAHCHHQMLPFELPPLLTAAGFAGIRREPVIYMNAEWHEHAYAYWAGRVVARFAESQGVSAEDSAAWLDQLQEAGKARRFGMVSVSAMVTAVAA